MKDVYKLKREQLESLARYRDSLRAEPKLRWVFFETTDRCNLHCRHCASSCTARGTELAVGEIERVLDNVKDRLDADDPMICLTGGEPLLHSDFFGICEAVTRRGFRFGITTNATLIDVNTARKLREIGMATVSVSVDGPEDCHNALRCSETAWEKAWNGIHCLQNEGFDVMVTSVFHSENLKRIDELYNILIKENIRQWRPINIEPVGRACESSSLLLNGDEIAFLLDYIKEKRFDHDCPIEVTYGCSHYLGIETERMVRDNYFICGAGIFTASVRSNGDIVSCLDVTDNSHTVQGNISRDEFCDVWKNGFGAFRRDRTEQSPVCSDCRDRYICGGDSAHTWDFEKRVPMLCIPGKK